MMGISWSSFGLLMTVQKPCIVQLVFNKIASSQWFSQIITYNKNTNRIFGHNKWHLQNSTIFSIRPHPIVPKNSDLRSHIFWTRHPINTASIIVLSICYVLNVLTIDTVVFGERWHMTNDDLFKLYWVLYNDCSQVPIWQWFEDIWGHTNVGIPFYI